MSEELPDRYLNWIEDYFVGRCENCKSRLYSVNNERLITITGKTVCPFSLRNDPENHMQTHVLRNS